MHSLIGLYPDVWETVRFSLMGFGVVMFVLAFLSILTSIIGKFFILADKLEANKKAAAAKAPVEQTVQKVKDISEISNPEHAFVVSAAVAAMMPELKSDSSELVAILSAAATVALGQECSVVSFKQAPDMAYAYHGRHQIYASKNYIPTRK